jgi:hypothetical protein
MMWFSCDDLALSDCNGTTPAQVYFQCFVDLWRECGTVEECNQAGECSDRSWTQVVTSTDPFKVHSFPMQNLHAQRIVYRCETVLAFPAALKLASIQCHIVPLPKIGQS